MELKITVRVPDDLYEKAKVKSKREDVTISQIVRRALRVWVNEDDLPEQKEEQK